MKRTGIGLLVGFLVVLGVPSRGYAKRAPAAFTMTCAGLAAPIDIVDAKALSIQFGPWGRRFLDGGRGAAPRPAAGSRQCVLAYYVAQGRDVRLAYVIHYCPGASPDEGYVYLPGRGDPWYSLNAASVPWPGQDGTWQHASRDWDAVIRSALARAAPGRAPAS